MPHKPDSFGLTEEELGKIIQVLKAYPEVQKAVIFGSRALGTYKRGSDIDIALFGNELEPVITKIAYQLNEEVVLPFFFDVVGYNGISNQELKDHINRVGISFYIGGTVMDKECCHAPKKEPHDHEGKEKSQSYWPLIVIFIYCLLLSLCRSVKQGPFFEEFMYGFMGYFFVFLSLFKFFDLKGFVDGFSTYDLITKKIKAYGYFYPFIELLLGGLYLANVELKAVNILTIAIMLVSGLGVLKSVVSGSKISCACLGTALNVPLGTVSIIENFGMALMALCMLLT